MVEFKIPDEEVTAMMSGRILDALSAETREQLVKDAIRYLTTKDYSGYRSNESPIQAAFNRALMVLAEKTATEVLEEQGVADNLRTMLTRLLADVPDIYTDWDLQTKMFKVILERAHEIRLGNQ